MTEVQNKPFGTWAARYRELGLWPRPLVGKACKLQGWQIPDPELPEGQVEKWNSEYADHNIGLLMGTPLKDGTLLGAIDIDHDDYVGLGRTLLNSPPCGRIGKKGVVFFVRFLPSLSSQKFRVKGKAGEKYGQIAECLFKKNLCAIPPSIHPDTNQLYRWIGMPLHEIDFNKLPLVGE